MKETLVSNVSIAFRKAVVAPTEDVKEAKKEHRTALKELTDIFMEKVRAGATDGIRNARDLVEVMKMDLLLMGEATEKIETDAASEVRINRISQAINLDDPNIQSLIADISSALNGANDDLDLAATKVDQDRLAQSLRDEESSAEPEDKGE